MEFLTWREVDFSGVILAGLVAGYVMAIAGLWAGQAPGLVAIDISDFGRRYMVSDRTSAWVLGFASHLANSRKLLGATVLSEEAAELVHLYVELMNADAPYTVMERAIHIHPTLAEAAQSAVSAL